jgi:hypothetical protein
VLGVVDLDEDDFSSLNYRRRAINTAEWSTDQVRDIAYDAEVKQNFLDSIFYDTEIGRKTLRSKIEEIIKQLRPGHVILEIVAGYMDEIYFSKTESCEIHYSRAADYLMTANSTFNRHMEWDFPLIVAFRKWATQNRPDLAAR